MKRESSSSAQKHESFSRPDPMEEIIQAITRIIALMTDVATHAEQIDDVQAHYLTTRRKVARLCRRFGFEDPNPFDDLWEWYAYWKENLDTWQSRRDYIRKLYKPLLKAVNQHGDIHLGSNLPGQSVEGWEQVDSQLELLTFRLATCSNSEDAQSVGLLCRDLMISLAEAAYDPAIHGEVSTGSGVDRLNAVVDHHAPGGSNEDLRRLAKATITYANTVQHRRDGELAEAAVVAEATVACVRIVRRVLDL